MSMGSMSTLPALTDFPTFYYAVVGSAVGVATLINIYNHVLCRQRLAAAKAGVLTPAKPLSWMALGLATTVAITREASNFSVHLPLKNRILRLPTAGRVTLICANVVVLIVLCLYGLDVNDIFSREDVGFRCGVVTIAQLPLIFLLSGKNNIIGFFTGISYERLNWIHRWCARCMLLTATLHMGYFFNGMLALTDLPFNTLTNMTTAWAPYNYIGYQLKNNQIVWKGLAAWCTLAWIVFSSMTPIRGWCYEFFVIQHIVSFAVLLGFVYIHTPVEVNVYIWIPVAIFFFDRIFRALRVLYANLAIFHPSSKRDGQAQGFLTCKAEFTSLPHDTTRIVIQNPPISWRPGQHVFLSCQAIAPLQNHPFTIASIPQDGRMEFFVKAESGGTRRFARHAEKTARSDVPIRYVTTNSPEEDTVFEAQKHHSQLENCVVSRISVLIICRTKTVTIEGPYGCLRPLRQFDSVVLLAGSTGATFTLPLLRDILQGWKENAAGIADGKQGLFSPHVGAATRHVRFVWVVKSRSQLGWLSEHLSSVSTEFETLQERLRDVKLELTVYITCDDTFTEEHKSLLSAISSPKQKVESAPEHGPVQYQGGLLSVNSEEKDLPKDGVKELAKIDSEVTGELQESCGPNGTCCCRTAIDETASPASKSACCCCSSSKETSVNKITQRPASQTSSTPPSSLKQQLLVHPSITIFSGRPKIRDIIRRSLEQALGESAVVVCGPTGLVADVKRDVCSLSDERAVHKGTGAQGIYLHTESYSY